MSVLRLVAELTGNNAGRIEPVQSLWSGYGTISRVLLQQPSKLPRTIIAKEVRPPAGSGVSHERKVHSYQVEAHFYLTYAEALVASGCNVPTPLHVATSGAGTPFALTILMTDLSHTFPHKASRLDLAHAEAALRWLAGFHAHFWESTPDPALWPDGCFWHLDTRLDELESMPREWAGLKNAAGLIDSRLKGLRPDGSLDRRFRTICHGDFKQENMAFNDQGRECAMVDFQYCGAGYGAKDIAYMMASSLDGGALRHERELLQHYHSCLHAALTARGVSCAEYTLDVLLEHFDLALLDFVRFMAGWGWWGNTAWAAAKARAALARLHA